MKRLLLYVPLLALMLACEGKKGTTSDNTDEDTVKVYENKYFSLQYPKGWLCDEEISNNDTDSVLILSEGVRVTLQDGAYDAPWQIVMVQKSAMPSVFETPEEWRNLSISFKQNDDRYLGVLEESLADSLDFKGCPAAATAFVALNEYGDTIIHKQVVVMVDKQLYYLNNSFLWDDDGECEQLGDDILSGITFKTKEEQQ